MTTTKHPTDRNPVAAAIEAATPPFDRSITDALVAAGATWWDYDDDALWPAFCAWLEAEHGMTADQFGRLDERLCDHLWARFESVVVDVRPEEPHDDEDLHPGDLVRFARRSGDRTEGRVSIVWGGPCGSGRCNNARCVSVATLRRNADGTSTTATLSIDEADLAKVPWSRFDAHTGAQVQGLPGQALLPEGVLR